MESHFGSDSEVYTYVLFMHNAVKFHGRMPLGNHSVATRPPSPSQMRI